MFRTDKNEPLFRAVHKTKEKPLKLITPLKHVHFESTNLSNVKISFLECYTFRFEFIVQNFIRILFF